MITGRGALDMYFIVALGMARFSQARRSSPRATCRSHLRLFTCQSDRNIKARMSPTALRSAGCYYCGRFRAAGLRLATTSVGASLRWCLRWCPGTSWALHRAERTATKFPKKENNDRRSCCGFCFLTWEPPSSPLGASLVSQIDTVPLSSSDAT